MNWRQELAGLLRRAGLGKGEPTQPEWTRSGARPTALDWAVGQLDEFHVQLLSERETPATKEELATALGLLTNVLVQILIEQHREDSREFLAPPPHSDAGLASNEDPERP